MNVLAFTFSSRGHLARGDKDRRPISHLGGREFSLITAAGILSIPSCASGLRYRFGGFTLVTARRFGIYDGELGAVLSGS